MAIHISFLKELSRNCNFKNYIFCLSCYMVSGTTMGWKCIPTILLLNVGCAKALVLFMGVRIVNFTPVAFRSHTYTGLFDQSWNWYFKFDFDLGIRHIFLYIEYTMPRYLYDIMMLISKLIKKKKYRDELWIFVSFFMFCSYIFVVLCLGLLLHIL